MSTTPKIHSHTGDREEVLEPESKKNWYVFYTSPRAEKVVQQELEFRGYEVFLPITKTLRIYKSRNKRMIDQVLFPSYIFVYTEECYLHQICQTPKIMTFIHCGGKPSKIDYNCICNIKQMMNLNEGITVEPAINIGENVRVKTGPLTGCEGKLVKKNSKTQFGIHIKEINYIVLIDICRNLVESIGDCF
jgi:transcription antitermination factor NusG